MNCLVGVGIDISDVKQAQRSLEESERRYRTTLDNILEGCQLIGFDWRYLYVNSAATQQNRRPISELTGRTMQEAWPGIENTSAFVPIRRCMEERIALSQEVEFVFPDGAARWFDLRVEPVPEGVFVLSLDITDRREAERALRDMNVSLERKVAERTEDLRLALTRAEAADRTKSAFLATMSHELRTPLNSIIGFTGILAQGLAGPVNEEQAKQLGMVRASSRHLLELINDVLDISKIEAGELEIYATTFDVFQSVHKIAELMTPAARAKGLSLEVVSNAPMTRVTSDQRRVEQILLNLVNNAVKFTDHGSVTVVIEAPDERWMRIRVADTGIGIRAENFEALFQPFRQIESGITRPYEGTGLGLAICSRLAGLLSAKIELESTWGEGSAFTLTLPIMPGVNHAKDYPADRG
jgi:PAS domain S-box-containing protein